MSLWCRLENRNVGSRTHYQNLQVTENASQEVIKGAYKYLAQKWHPDKHPENRQEAERITKIINAAYAVLNDPAQRKEYDDYLRGKRHRKQEDNSKNPASTTARPSDSTSESSRFSRENLRERHKVYQPPNKSYDSNFVPSNSEVGESFVEIGKSAFLLFKKVLGSALVLIAVFFLFIAFFLSEDYQGDKTPAIVFWIFVWLMGWYLYRSK